MSVFMQKHPKFLSLDNKVLSDLKLQKKNFTNSNLLGTVHKVCGHFLTNFFSINYHAQL